jgi:hypothetical protein
MWHDEAVQSITAMQPFSRRSRLAMWSVLRRALVVRRCGGLSFQHNVARPSWTPSPDRTMMRSHVSLGAVMDIVVWLRSLGLGKYEAVFRENDIDEAVLPSLTHENLKELGVASLGHRVKLLDAIAALRSDASGKTPSGGRRLRRKAGLCSGFNSRTLSKH